jgi:dipeptidyl aminopeptidase/acylaminoacyl peptidase
MLLALLLATTPVQAAYDALAKRIDFSAVSIAPDAKHVAYAVKAANASDRTSLYIAEPGGKPQRAGACAEGRACEDDSPVFSPDGKRLAFLSDAAKHGDTQLYVREPGQAPRKLTQLHGRISNPRWSPDGKQLAFLFVDADLQGPLGASARAIGVIGQTEHEQRIYVVDAKGGGARAVSPADLYVYEYDWAPKGERFAAIGAHGNGDNNWWVARLYVVDGGAASEIYKPRTQLSWPRWSPDGKRVAFIEGLMSDEGLSGGDLYVVEPGQPARNLTPDRPSSPSTLEWTSPSRIVFGEWADGASAFAALDVDHGTFEPLWQGPMHAGVDSAAVSQALAADGRTSAVVLQSQTKAPELFLGPIGQWQPVTHLQTVKVSWGEARSIHFEHDGRKEQAWLVGPANVPAGQKLPVVVVVHGGPGWEACPRFDTINALTAMGVYVLAPNPRGSFGFGEKFTQGNVKDFGGGDLQDILAALDAAGAQAPVDASRAGMFGWSYGGYMAMWTVTQTQRFKAVVAGAGIANWQSYYGQNLIDQWMIPYFGASVYADPAVYAKSSPMSFITHAKTPTLVLVGERDAECPAPQSFEFWHALRALGVETQLVVYPDEGHRFKKPEHLSDRLERIAEWFQKHL